MKIVVDSLFGIAVSSAIVFPLAYTFNVMLGVDVLNVYVCVVFVVAGTSLAVLELRK